MVTINTTRINSAEVKDAAADAGLSHKQLRDLAKQVGLLATGMKFGEEAQALSSLSVVLLDAANSLGQGTSQPGAVDPSPVGTSRPGM